MRWGWSRSQRCMCPIGWLEISCMLQSSSSSGSGASLVVRADLAARWDGAATNMAARWARAAAEGAGCGRVGRLVNLSGTRRAQGDRVHTYTTERYAA
eukprot:3377639-Prymnesium_polylepis.1